MQIFLILFIRISKHKKVSIREDERFGDYGFSKKEFDGEEMVDVEEDEEEDSYLDLDESSDDDM